MNKTISGYKGIMELDLSGVHPSHHRELIKQHKQKHAACACVYLCLLHVHCCILIHITCEPQGSDITYVENNKQHCNNAMC